MTKLQRIQIEMKAKLDRGNALAEKPTRTEAERNELATINADLEHLHFQFNAALATQAQDELEALGLFEGGDGESAERGRLLRDVKMTDYLTPAATGNAPIGAAAELGAALEVPIVGQNGAVQIPWAVLAGPAPGQLNQGRIRGALTDTGDLGGGTVQRPILQRLFGMDILGALGVRLDSVPSGMTEWPLLSGGVEPQAKPEGIAADAAVAASFKPITLKQKKLTGRYEFTHEMASQVPGIESALRRDLGDAVRARMSELALNGNATTNPEQPNGFLTVLDAPAAPSAIADFATYAGSHAGAVDGIHASMETQVESVIGVAAYRHSATVYQSGSGESGSEALQRRSMRCMASNFVPAAPTTGGRANIQDGNIYHAAGPAGGGADMRGDSVAAVWPSLSIIRDIYTQASQGVVLTWVSLWDMQAAFRADAYKRVAFKLS